MADDRKGLELMLKGQDAQYDYEFFMLLTNSLERASAMGDQKAIQQLEMLRQQLMGLTTYGKRVAKQEAAIASLKEIKSPEEFFRADNERRSG